MADNVRELHATTTRKPAPTLKAKRGIPKPPDWLDTEAIAEWNRVTPELHEMGVLALIDRGALAGYCDAWSHFVAAAREMNGPLAVDDRRHDTKRNPAWVAYTQASRLVSEKAKELGLSPNSRGRMKAPDVEPNGVTDSILD
jgi:P27 family predicted phage terminase small subunit